MKLAFSGPARDYARAETRYLRLHNPQAARRFVNDLRRLAVLLGDFPHAGPPRREHPLPGVFRFVLGSYLVDYEIRGTIIVVLAIRHGRQAGPDIPLNGEFDVDSDSG